MGSKGFLKICSWNVSVKFTSVLLPLFTFVACLFSFPHFTSFLLFCFYYFKCKADFYDHNIKGDGLSPYHLHVCDVSVLPLFCPQAALHVFFPPTSKFSPIAY